MLKPASTTDVRGRRYERTIDHSYVRLMSIEDVRAQNRQLGLVHVDGALAACRPKEQRVDVCRGEDPELQRKRADKTELNDMERLKR